MTASTFARSLSSSASRRWRALRLRSRMALALFVAVAVSLGMWAILPDRPDEWPARVVLALPVQNHPLAFSPDGRTFLSMGVAGLIPWDTRTGRPGTPWATNKGVFLTGGAYSPDGRTFAAAIFQNPSGSIDLIDTSTGRTTATLSTRHPVIDHLTFVDGGKTLLAFVGDGLSPKEAVSWDLATDRQESSRPLSATTRGWATAFSPDGKMLAIVPFPTNTVHLWDLEADATLGSVPDPGQSRVGLSHGVAFAPDGRTLAVSRLDGAVDLWDIASRTLVKTLPAHSPGYVSMALRFGPDGRTIATLGSEAATTTGLARAFDDLKRRLLGSALRGGSEMVVVDVASGRRIGRSHSSHYPIYAPDGRTIATTGEDLGVRLHDLPAGPGAKEARP